ncbi:MAG: tetratricopeptide repeat protein [Pyrinomonadaceae bacterium]
MTFQTSASQQQKDVTAPAALIVRCRRAKDLEEAGEFDQAREEILPFWPTLGQRPDISGLTTPEKAELLLRAGTLTGWLGSARQLPGAQEIAKDLLSESAATFGHIGRNEKVAEAMVDLATCYLREGGLDEARVTLQHALDTVADLADSEQRLRALVNSAIVEQVATHYDEALRIYRSAASLFDRSSNDSLKGKFHNSYALFLKSLGLSQEREDYIDQALLEFEAARFHFEEAGHNRFRARVENNEGFLFASLGKFSEAHEHLNRARALHQSMGDRGGVAGADDTRAQTLLLEGKVHEAEKIARVAVRSLSDGGEQSTLAEALTTHGKALARLKQANQARKQLDHAIEVAQHAGDPECGGTAALTAIEELGSDLSPDTLLSYYTAAETLLANSQHRRLRMRLGECARRLLSSNLTLPASPVRQDVPQQAIADCSLEAAVHRYEANLIRQALESAGGSVTRAARILGVTHQGLAFILNGRHSDLLTARTPVKRRRRSIIKHR